MNFFFDKKIKTPGKHLERHFPGEKEVIDS